MQRSKAHFCGFAAALVVFGIAGRNAAAQDLFSGGGTVYLPYAGGGGGFMPYTPGPGGGLGVQSAPARLMARPVGGTSERAMGGGWNASMTPGFGGLRTSLTPLTPIRSGGRGMGMGGPLSRRLSSGGAMAEPPRSPVGGYPFRQPASGPGQGGAMGMQ